MPAAGTYRGYRRVNTEIDGVSFSSLLESENNFTIRDGNLVTDFICNGLVTTFKHREFPHISPQQGLESRRQFVIRQRCGLRALRSLTDCISSASADNSWSGLGRLTGWL
jgi:hypothetical protein